MKKFDELLEGLKDLQHLEYYSDTSIVLNEAIHKELEDILNDTDDDSIHNRLKRLTYRTRELVSSGEDTGIESGRPKKGTSRAVFFPKDNKEVVVDGVKTSIPVAIKVAFPGQLDKYKRHDEPLLGEMQNNQEIGSHGFERHNVLYPVDYGPSTLKTNRWGVLPPLFEHHEFGHHLTVGRIKPASARDIREATKTENYPKGLSLEDIKGALEQQWHYAHGTGHINKTKEDHYNKMVENHPWLDNAVDYHLNHGTMPSDIAPRNIGIFEHPVTGQKHLVFSDYGGSENVLKQYGKLRERMRSHMYSKKY